MHGKPLSTLKIKQPAQIIAIQTIKPNDFVAQRLKDLGFTVGEKVQVVERTLFKNGPLVVKIDGINRFAFRKNEADRILVVEVHDAYS